MPIFFYISIVVPLTIAIGLPRVLRHYGLKEHDWRWLLYTACGLFFISWYLPSPLIEGQDTSFTTHFVGGGLFTGMVWWYLVRATGWRASWVAEGFSLFALVSALGCLNELAELCMVKLGVARITLTDTNWDILANTLGAAVVWAGWLLIGSRSRRASSRRIQR